MGYMIRQIEANAKITDQAMLEAMESVIPYSTLAAVVEAQGVRRQRRRKLSAEIGLMLVIVMNLFANLSMTQVLWKLLQGFRLLWPEPEFEPASKGAISQLRYELGVAPIRDLFQRVCKPMASENTPGAFLYGLRLMGLDGVDEMVPDTPENAKAFGRHRNERGEAGYPQLQSVYLVECGTHAIVDAGFWPLHASEREGGFRLLRSVHPGMLLMWDCGFHSFDMVKSTHQQRHAHVLARLPAHVKPELVKPLPDGSYLAYLRPSEYHRRKSGEKILIRVIEYTVTDPVLPGYGEKHRLITSLLNHRLYPALELAQNYHQRWEVEITIDETDTHQRLAYHPLRSQKPAGVIQELYGLLLAHYIVRKIMLDAATQADLDPDRLSFTNALRLICSAIPEFQLVAPDQHSLLYQRLLRDIARFILPQRDNRCNPRVVKRKMSNFKLKRPEHAHPPRPKSSFADAIAILI